MAIRTVRVTVQGTSPILMHAYPLIPIEAIDKKTTEEQAELVAYRVPNESLKPNQRELYIPGIAIRQSMVNAATYSKGKGRASLQKPVAACVMVTPEYCLLGTNKFNIDSRAVVNPTTKGRIVRHRPRLETGWRVSFTLEYESNLLTADQLRRVLDDSGLRVGLLDFRPEKKGMFGRFNVVHWEPEPEAAEEDESDVADVEPEEEEEETQD